MTTPTPTPDNFTPVRAKSNGRLLCFINPEQGVLLFKYKDWEERIDLAAEYGIPAQHNPPPVSAVGYVLLPVEAARLAEVVKGEGE